MELDQLGNIGEFVSAVAVVASLIYVGIQIRQNTRATQAATLQEVCRDMREQFSAPAIILEAMRKLSDGEKLSFEEQLRWGQYTLNTFRMYENQWFQNQKGMLDDTLFRGYQAHVLGTLGSPGVSEMWDRMKERLFHPEFVSNVERLRETHSEFPLFVTGKSRKVR